MEFVHERPESIEFGSKRFSRFGLQRVQWRVHKQGSQSLANVVFPLPFRLVFWNQIEYDVLHGFWRWADHEYGVETLLKHPHVLLLNK
jgi:hypothetical protein